MWDEIGRDAQLKRQIVEWVGAMSQSAEWLRDGGTYAPSPKKIISELRYLNPLTPSALYHRECQSVWEYFLEATEQPKSANKLTPDRLAMIADRLREAMCMKSELDPEGERSLMKDAVDACRASPYHQKHPDAMTIESVFRSSEQFEKWVKKEVPA